MPEHTCKFGYNNSRRRRKSLYSPDEGTHDDPDNRGRAFHGALHHFKRAIERSQRPIIYELSLLRVAEIEYRSPSSHCISMSARAACKEDLIPLPAYCSCKVPMEAT